MFKNIPVIYVSKSNQLVELSMSFSFPVCEVLEYLSLTYVAKQSVSKIIPLMYVIKLNQISEQVWAFI